MSPAVDAKKSGGIILIVSGSGDTLITTIINNSVDITSVRNKPEDIS